MNLKRVTDIFEIIKNRLPASYIKPKLAFYEDEDCMLDNLQEVKHEGEIVHAMVDHHTNTISLPMKLTLEFEDKDGNIINKEVPINKRTDEDIFFVLLHECGHLFLGKKYGHNSKQYHDEKRCDRFARKWIRVLKKEKLL